ncbi:MAG: glycogen synthase GlgA [Firmicutes bacterium]|nr:glycogen synthase GlgA [Bacillota bacterium]
MTENKEKLKVLFASFEAAPFSKTGGLGDVAASLPGYLAKEDCDIRVILPKLKCIPQRFTDRMEYVENYTVPLSWRNCYCGLFELKYNGITYYFLDNEYYFKRDNIYGEFDDGERVAFFSKAVLETLLHLTDFMPDIIHCNDWHTALIPVFLNEMYKNLYGFEYMKTVLTVHNLKFQGQYSEMVIGDICGLMGTDADRQMRMPDGSANYLLGGLRYADKITTVSPTYAEEICTPYFGEGLDWLFSERRDRLCGILNGIDTKQFDPAADKYLTAHFSMEQPYGKKRCKAALQKELGLDPSCDKPMFALISRLTEQKGMDLINYDLPWIVESGAQLVVLGQGDPKFEESLLWYSRSHQGQICARLEFSEALSRRIYAGADALLMPSRFEPCGLSQMIAMRYGTIPVVRETGGLKDSVIPYNKYTGEGTGFSFATFNALDLKAAMEGVMELYADKRRWYILRKRVMHQDFSWSASAKQYRRMYGELTGK